MGANNVGKANFKFEKERMNFTGGSKPICKIAPDWVYFRTFPENIVTLLFCCNLGIEETIC